MFTVEKHGNYSIIMYDKDLITIDFSDGDIGFTLKTFDNLDDALKVFNNTVKKLSLYKAKFHDTQTVKQIISSK